MLKEYTFYCRHEEYPFNKGFKEIFLVNNHKVSEEVYGILYKRVTNNYTQYTLQDHYWKNYTNGAYTHSKTLTFGKLTILERKLEQWN